MKKLLLLFLAVLMTVTSCKSNKDRILEIFADGVAQIEAALPVSTPLGDITDAELDGSQIVVTIELTEVYATLVGSGVSLNAEMGALGFIAPLYESGEFTMDDIRESELSMKYRYCDAGGNILQELVVTNQEVRAAFAKLRNRQSGMPLYDSQYYIDMVVNANKPNLPIDLGAGITLVDVRGLDGGILMVYELSDDIYHGLEFTDEMIQSVRESMVRELQAMAAADAVMFDDMTRNGIFYRYEYRTESGDIAMSIEIPLAQL